MKPKHVSFLVTVVGLALIATVAVRRRATDEEPQPTPVAEDHKYDLVISLREDPEHLNPLRSGPDLLSLSELLLDGLYNRGPVASDGTLTFEPALGLAPQFASDENRRDVYIQLRDNVFWNTGKGEGSATPSPRQRFTADDVVFTWGALAASSYYRLPLLKYYISGVEKIDDSRVLFHFDIDMTEQGIKDLLSMFKILPCTYRGAPLPQNFTIPGDGKVGDFNYSPIGTGAFWIRERSAGHIWLQRNDSYFQKASIQHLAFDIFRDVQTSVEALIQGHVDMDLDVPVSLQARLETPKGTDLAKSFRPVVYQPLAVFALVFNQKKPPFDNPVIRRAVADAIDKRRLFREFSGMTDSIDPFIVESIFPPGYEFAYALKRGIVGNQLPAPRPPRAVTGRPHFEFLISKEMYGDRVELAAKAIVDMMARINVDATWRDLARNTFLAEVEHRQYQSVLWEFGGFDSSFDVRPLFEANGSENLFGIDDQTLTSLARDHAGTLYRPDKERLTRQIQARVQDLTAACFLFSRPRVAYIRATFDNVAPHPDAVFAGVPQWKRK